MIKSPQPSGGVMKWPVLAEDLDDLSVCTSSICRAREAEAQPFMCRRPLIIIKLICCVHKSSTELDF